MTHFTARELLFLSEDQVDQLIPEGVFHSLVFDDGSVLDQLTKAETRYSHWFWAIVRQYPKISLLPKHHVNFTLKRGKDALTTGTHLKLCTQILKTIVAEYNLRLPKQKEPLLRLIYQTISNVMKKLAVETERDVISLDIVDFVQIAHHPKILALKQEAMADPDKIKYAYEKIIEEIEVNPVFDDNGLAKAVRSKMVKPNQVLQCVAFRGVPSEVDGTVYQHPIWSNYTDGMNKFYDLVTDSRTAAKSHFYADSALQDSEYRARKFQLNAMVLERIAYVDCNSSNLMPWKVQGKRFDDSGTEIYPGDLPMMVGKYYKVDKNDEFKIIEGNESHLTGKTIWFRTVLDCTHHDPHAVCAVCAGELSQNIAHHANIGHLGTVTLTRDFTQNILSIKHVNMSAVVLRILLGEFERKYLNTGARGEAYYLNKPERGSKVLITILSDEAPGLLEIDTSGQDNSYLHLSLSRISQVTRILHTTIRKLPNGEISKVSVPLTVQLKNNIPMLTHEVLGYLSKKGWEIDEENNFVFDMSDWNYASPLLVLQSKEESFVDLADEVKSMIQSSQKNHKKRIVENAYRVLLQELFDTVNRKLRINILSMEILIYGLMTKSEKSFALARNAKNPVLGIGDALTMHRSLGQAMAFQGHEDAIFEPCYFYRGERPNNPMDVFLCPKEVVSDRSR